MLKKREAGAGKLFAAHASNLDVTGKGLLKRILLALGIAAAFLMYLAAVQAYATPIRPDIRKLVTQPQQDATAQAVPARAGWDGPEMAAGQQERISLESFSAERLARAQRAELMAAATPDPRAILGIVAVIFLLRLLRQQEEKRPRMQLAPAPAREDSKRRIAA
jgi:hypothetical protein